MANSVGHLYVTVSADVRSAIGELEKLDKQAKATADSISRMGGGSSGTGALRSQTGALKETEKSAKAAANAVGQIGLRAQSATKPVTALQTAMFRTSQAFVNLRYGNPIGLLANLGQAASAARVGVAGLGAAGMSAAAGITALAVAAPVAAAAVGTLLGVKIAERGLDAAASLEMVRIQYEGLLDTAERANAEVDWLEKLAMSSVVPTEVLQEANLKLLQYGVDADDTRHKLVQFVSDFGSAVNLTESNIQNLSYALGQIQSLGTVRLPELNQLSQTLPIGKIADALNMSVAELRAAVTAGAVSSAELFEGIDKLGKKFDETAEKARNSVRGMLANIQDGITARSGRAFETVLTKLKPILRWVEQFIASFDFGKVAKAFENAIDYISQALQGVGDDAKEVSGGVADFIANSVNLVAWVVANVIRAVKPFFYIVSALFNAVWASIQILVSGTLYSVSAIMQGAAYAAGVVNAEWGASMQASADSVWMMANEADKGAQAASNSMVNAAVQSGQAWLQTLGIINFTTTAANNAANNNSTTNGDLPATTPRSNTPALPTPTLPTTGTGGSSTGAAAPDPAIKKWQDWVKKMRELVNTFKSAYKEIKDMSKESFGELSAISEALFFTGNKKGGYDPGDFEGDVKSIISNYDKLSEAIKEYYKVFESPAVAGKKAAAKASAQRDKEIATLKAQTAELVRLARENAVLAEKLADWKEAETDRLNDLVEAASDKYDTDRSNMEKYYDGLASVAEKALDKATEAYEDANSRLQDMLSERDDFLNGIRESARSLVNGLSMSEETISQFTRIDAVGSFLQEEKTKSQTFKDALSTRLQTMKEFAANVTTLIARGLDEALLRDLVSAGPESAGATLKELANSDDLALQEVNAIQADLANTVGGLQTTVSKTWFDAAITDQQNYVAQQQAAMVAAQANVDSIAALREQSLLQLEETYKRQQAALEEQIKLVEAAEDAHSQEMVQLMQDNDDAAAKIAQSIEDRMSWLTSKDNDKNLAILGKQAMDGFIRGLEAKEEMVVATAERIARRVAKTIRDALNINSPSKVTEQIGMYVGEGLALGMESSLSRVDSASMALASASLPSIPDRQSSGGVPEIRVFIGDKELTDLIDIRIEASDGTSLDYVTAGRRY